MEEHQTPTPLLIDWLTVGTADHLCGNWLVGSKRSFAITPRGIILINNKKRMLYSKEKEDWNYPLITIVFFILVILIGALSMIYLPKYGVYRQNLKGQANLKQQEFEKQIIVEQAKAELESARSLADAEIERARGVAEANRIIGDSLNSGGDKYLQYLAIDAQKKMADSPNNTVLYIPSGNNAIPLVQTVK